MSFEGHLVHFPKFSLYCKFLTTDHLTFEGEGGWHLEGGGVVGKIWSVHKFFPLFRNKANNFSSQKAMQDIKFNGHKFSPLLSKVKGTAEIFFIHLPPSLPPSKFKWSAI